MNPQMIINGTLMPECSNDRYSCYPDDGNIKLEMVSRRKVIEARASVWIVSAEFDYLEDSVLRPVLATLRSGKPFPATVLPDNSTETVTSTFVVESLTPPNLLAFDGTEPIWHGLSFVLREERPHD